MIIKRAPLRLFKSVSYTHLHANAITNSKWTGAQTFYDPKKVENKKLATAIMMSMKSNLEGTTTREPKSISSLFILKNSNIPTALVEIGFLSNPEEADLLNTESYQDQIAYSLSLIHIFPTLTS